MNGALSSRDWFGKASAGLVLGLLIALGCAGLLSRALGIEETYFSLPGQFTMWTMAPVWCLILSFCFLFRSGLRAWGVLGAVSGAVWSVLIGWSAMA